MHHFLLIALFFTTSIAHATQYTVQQDKSTITFAGQHAGQPFEGVFENWQADIVFDPTNLDQSRISATIDVSTALTGNAMYDRTLPKTDWFDTANHPQATFKSTKIAKQQAENQYIAQGQLTLKGISQPLNLPFTLEEQENGVLATSTFAVNRLDYNIGKQSDPQAEWVAEEIKLRLTLHAQ